MLRPKPLAVLLSLAAVSTSLAQSWVAQILGKPQSTVNRVLGMNRAKVADNVSLLYPEVKGLIGVRLLFKNGLSYDVEIEYRKPAPDWKSGLKQLGFSTKGVAVASKGRYDTGVTYVTLNGIKGVPAGWEVRFSPPQKTKMGTRNMEFPASLWLGLD